MGNGYVVPRTEKSKQNPWEFSFGHPMKAPESWLIGAPDRPSWDDQTKPEMKESEQRVAPNAMRMPSMSKANVNDGSSNPHTSSNSYSQTRSHQKVAADTRSKEQLDAFRLQERVTLLEAEFTKQTKQNQNLEFQIQHLAGYNAQLTRLAQLERANSEREASQKKELFEELTRFRDETNNLRAWNQQLLAQLRRYVPLEMQEGNQEGNHEEPESGTEGEESAGSLYDEFVDATPQTPAPASGRNSEIMSMHNRLVEYYGNAIRYGEYTP